MARYHQMDFSGGMRIPGSPRREFQENEAEELLHCIIEWDKRPRRRDFVTQILDTGDSNLINSLGILSVDGILGLKIGTVSGANSTFVDDTKDALSNTNNLFDLSTTTNNTGFSVGSLLTFNRVVINVSTAEAGTASTWAYQYNNGSSWSNLTTIIEPDFRQTGDQLLLFKIPSDWVRGVPDTNQLDFDAVLYWIRCRATTAPGTTGADARLFKVSSPNSSEFFVFQQDDKIKTFSQDILLSYVQDVGSGTAGTAQLSGPVGVAVKQSDGNVYVVNGNAIFVFSEAGVFVSPSFGTLTTPSGIILDSNDNIFVANTGGNTVEKFDSAHSSDGSVALTNAQAVAVDSNDLVYATNQTNVITRYTNALASSATYTDTDGTSTFYGVTVDSVGDVFAIDKANTRIRKYDVSENSWSTFYTMAAVGTEPELAIDEEDNLYFPNGNFRLQVVNSSGTLIFYTLGNSSSAANAIDRPLISDEACGVGYGRGLVYVSGTAADNTIKKFAKVRTIVDGIDSANLEMVQFKDELIMSNGVDPIRTFDGREVHTLGAPRHIVSAVDAGAGNIGAGDYAYRVTFVATITIDGVSIAFESAPSQQSIRVTIAANRNITVSNIPIPSTIFGDASSFYTARRLYRAQFDGNTGAFGTYRQVTAFTAGNLNDITTTSITDNDADISTERILSENSANFPVGKLIERHQGRLWIAGNPEFNDRIYFTDFRDRTKAGESQEDIDMIDLSKHFLAVDQGDSDFITGMKSAFGHLIIWKKFSTWVLLGVNEEPGTYTIRKLDSEIGCIDVRSIVVIPGGNVYWLSHDGLYEINANLQIRYSSENISPDLDTIITNVQAGTHSFVGGYLGQAAAWVQYEDGDNSTGDAYMLNLLFRDCWTKFDTFRARGFAIGNDGTEYLAYYDNTNSLAKIGKFDSNATTEATGIGTSTMTVTTRPLEGESSTMPDRKNFLKGYAKMFLKDTALNAIKFNKNYGDYTDIVVVGDRNEPLQIDKINFTYWKFKDGATNAHVLQLRFTHASLQKLYAFFVEFNTIGWQ